MEEGVDGVRELLLRDSRCGGRGIVPVTLRIERLEGVRVEGKEEREVWRLRRVAVLPVAPLVEGRYERTDVIFGQSTGRRIFKIVHTRREEKRREWNGSRVERQSIHAGVAWIFSSAKGLKAGGCVKEGGY